MPRILITGSLGQIGSELILLLRKKYGNENVIGTDIRKLTRKGNDNSPFYYLDVTNKQEFQKLIVELDIDWIIHNASILSAAGERNPQLALNVNIRGLETALEVARSNELRILSPSSIAAFGPTTPKLNTPDITIMRPTTIYGVSKVYVELLGEYYYNKWNVDFRSLRYPGIISSETLPGGGTTDYAVSIFYDALLKHKFECFLKEDTTLPMMYMPDCLNGTIKLLETPMDKLTQRTYNIAALSFNPRELYQSIKKIIPDFQIAYKPDYRQAIAESWPMSIDDSVARRDWDWKNEYNLDNMTKDMILKLSKKLNININVPS